MNGRLRIRAPSAFGEVKRGMSGAKMRGTDRDAETRTFTIDQNGTRLGLSFRPVTRILAGTPVHVSPGGIERIRSRLDAGTVGDARSWNHCPPSPSGSPAARVIALGISRS